ncbi:hypothetical protein RFI_22031, partial [Reticulomyxa filosa]
TLLPVDFMHGGYLVRIRPHLAEFLYQCNQWYDVVLFTAADGSVILYCSHANYHLNQFLWEQLELERKDETISKDEITMEPKRLWKNAHYRDDCDVMTDEFGSPYRHKNITKLAVDLSLVVIVDDNPLSYRGFEPNAIRIAPFWGTLLPPDNEVFFDTLPLFTCAFAFSMYLSVVTHTHVHVYIS